jgi:hypothetical protein
MIGRLSPTRAIAPTQVLGPGFNLWIRLISNHESRSRAQRTCPENKVNDRLIDPDLFTANPVDNDIRVDQLQVMNAPRDLDLCVFKPLQMTDRPPVKKDIDSQWKGSPKVDANSLVHCRWLPRKQARLAMY